MKNKGFGKSQKETAQAQGRAPLPFLETELPRDETGVPLGKTALPFCKTGVPLGETALPLGQTGVQFYETELPSGGTGLAFWQTEEALRRTDLPSGQAVLAFGCPPFLSGMTSKSWGEPTRVTWTTALLRENFIRALGRLHPYLHASFMATLKPFAALRPKPELASQICELPYDVMSSDEAREMARGNPLSFLHVSKPEIDLPPGTDVHAPEVYAKGAENFQKLISQGALKQDSQPNFYLYRQIMGGHSQVGLVAAASCEEYLANIIKKHEFTRPDKEDDRVRHIETLNSQTGPVFLTYKAVGALDEFVAKKISETTAIDFTGKDGVRHSSWNISDPLDILFIETQFAQIPFLYIADGHHRSAAAARVFQSRKGAGHSGQFLTVIFPHNQMQILPYNRVLKELNGLTPQELLKKLGEVFNIIRMGLPTPTRKHELGLYMNRRWHTLTFKPKLTAGKDAIEQLDVSLLQDLVLAPLFGIDDPRTSKKINFVGGIRGTAELEKLVDSGEYACAFSMFPTSIEDLMSIADAGGIMPPKSTWFEPKLRDAMFCHMI